MRRRLGWLAGIAALAGCGSTSGAPSTSTTAPATATTTSTTSTTTTITSSPTTSATSTGAPAPAHAASFACRSGQIAVTAALGGAGLGHVGVVLRFRSTASTTCTLSGYPGATLATAQGRDVPARRTPTGYLGGVASASGAVAAVHLAPGQSASAYLEGLDSDLAHGGGPCPRYAHLLVTPPNQTVTARMISPLTAVCRPEVHPVVAGTTGRATGAH